MLKADKTSPSKPSFLRQELHELENQIARMVAEKTVKRLVLETFAKHKNNAEYYSQWGDGYLMTAQYLESLEGVPEAFRYQLALAIIESNELGGK